MVRTTCSLWRTMDDGREICLQHNYTHSRTTFETGSTVRLRLVVDSAG